MICHTIEGQTLKKAIQIVEDCSSRYENAVIARLSLLEQVSCALSGIPLEVYRNALGYKDYVSVPSDVVENLIDAIRLASMPYALSLASLANMEANGIETRRRGAIYTDFRLANNLANELMRDYKGGAIIDPACGTSIILAACALKVSSDEETSFFVSNHLYGVDLSELAIRGSILVMATFLRTEEELLLTKDHFICADSLELGRDLLSLFNLEAFEYVIGNPPWERVRPSKNEYANEHGLNKVYGEDIENLPEGFERHRNKSKEISLRISKAFDLKGGTDLYRAFLNLSMDICAANGSVSLYVPAGLIRSKSLASTRKYILETFSDIRVSVFSNRPKYFAIDSRFKFLLLRLSGKNQANVCKGAQIEYCSADNNHVYVTSELFIGSNLFCDKSGELGVPEIKTAAEESILNNIWSSSIRLSNHALFQDAKPVRELDMTLDKKYFIRHKEGIRTNELIPVIEGRMVNQYICGAKKYISGEGRSAKWALNPLGESSIDPQFYISRESLGEETAARIDQIRVGFCDIAGQTNERAMQAAIIPAGTVCGNKVPTIIFPNPNVLNIWIGVTNSLVFDWLIRRYITTTVNFFILNNMPYPSLKQDDELACLISQSVQNILDLERTGTLATEDGLWDYAVQRARIDAYVARAYGLSGNDMEIIFEDFPLIDRVNNEITNGISPTLNLIRAIIADDNQAIRRTRNCLDAGAIPYATNEYMRCFLGTRKAK